MTAIFRELGSQFAISKLLPNNEKCKIIILGCSDGSAAYSYAIMLRKFLGRQAKNNIKISGVDINPAVVEMANTGYLAVSDTELNRVLSKGFLDSKELGHYLKKSNCPPLFPELLKKYPKLRYLKENPIEYNEPISSLVLTLAVAKYL